MRKGFLYYMRKWANISPYMRRRLVIYDFAPDPSEGTSSPPTHDSLGICVEKWLAEKEG
jgi:hypothetical protein